MTKQTIQNALTAMALAMTLAVGYAQNAAAPASEFDEFAKNMKNPTDWLNWGTDLRLRNEYLDNALTLRNDVPGNASEQNYGRYRARIWATAKPADNLSINARITAEPRLWTKPSFSRRAVPGGVGAGAVSRVTGWDWTEGVVDSLNFKWDNVADLPMTITVGRQDIMIGDMLNWWLVCDGTPGDGSRTFYFDAARITYKLEDYNTTVDVIALDNAAMNDGHFLVLNGLKKMLTEQHERGAILYVSNKSIEKTQIDAYFMYKNDSRYENTTQVPLVTMGDQANLYTFGAKVSGDVQDNWKYSVEIAGQMGSRSDPDLYRNTLRRDVMAWGANSRLTYLFKDDLNQNIRLNLEYLSGDDPTTTENEQFDSLWGRWPRWSEVYIYSVAGENRIAQIGNLVRFGPGYSISPTKKLTLNAEYNMLFADQARGAALANAAAFGTGTFRGHFVQLWAKYKFNQYLSGHLWAEEVFTGDFYSNHETHTFMRAEVMLTF